MRSFLPVGCGPDFAPANTPIADRAVAAMKRPSLLSQILALNLLMVTAGIFVASIASGLDLTIQGQRWQFLILAMALLLTFLLNTLLLRRRFEEQRGLG